jgi:HD-GYP domain-containing protein (c-di-GMP phosphodiesterase class II)
LRLVSLVGLSLFPVLLLVVGAGVWLRAIGGRNAEEETRRYGELIVLTLESQLGHTDELLTTLSQSLDPEAISDPRCGALMRSLMAERPRYLQIGAALADGRVVCSGLPLTGMVDISDRLYFRQAVETKGFALGEYQIGRITQLPSINAAMPILAPDGAVRAVVYAALDLKFFESLFEELSLPDGTTLMLFHSDGRVLARFPEPHLWVGETIGGSELFAKTRDSDVTHSVTLVDSDGIERTFAHYVLDTRATNPIEFVVAVPTATLTGQTDGLIAALLLGYGGILSGSLAAAWLAGERTILRFLRPLLAATEQMAMDGPTHISLPRTNIREFNQLGQAFEKMSRSLVDEIDRRALAERQTFRRLNQLSALRAIDQAILAGEGMAATLDVFIEEACRQLGARSGKVYLRHADSGALSPAAGRLADQNSPLEPGELGTGLAGVAAESGRIENLWIPLEPVGQAQNHSGAINLCAIPLMSKGEVTGVLEVGLPDDVAADEDWRQFASMLASQAAIAIENALLLDALQASRAKIESAYDETIAGWAAALDLRDEETQGHSGRVAALTLVLAERLGVAPEELVHMRRGALLHDVGKLGIPDVILHKPGRLNDAEWQEMKLHPVYAFEWLSRIEYLRPALEIPHYHHERWDGSGYPEGLRGKDIPLAARIFSVVDVWDALTHARPYRPAWDESEALEYLRANSGLLFDPRVVVAFLAMCEEGVHERVARASA